MKVVNYYTPCIESFDKTGSLKTALSTNEQLTVLKKMAEEWGIDLENAERWMKGDEYKSQRKLAVSFTTLATEVVDKVESIFGKKLEGEVRLSPSLMRFDGFARYDSGSHAVWFGIDHPDADEGYLKALMAHELSHVYRDHQPKVWSFLGKPLTDVSRKEYLDAMTAHEHITSEGLATLFSQLVYPEVPLHLHHYYFPEEMQWCLANYSKIDKAIIDCLKTDQEIWKFYEDDIIEEGSPSRTQYYWSARKINEWLTTNHVKSPSDYKTALIQAHGWHAGEFLCFQ
ncbi:MAG: DUF5700 domain-containing putative Zn-dependent protease [Oligoflexia bacterium]|nr:DUF5700 domain-containing putative Zn-dependent protease [Oligoflexia bacterium]